MQVSTNVTEYLRHAPTVGSRPTISLQALKNSHCIILTGVTNDNMSVIHTLTLSIHRWLRQEPPVCSSQAQSVLQAPEEHPMNPGLFVMPSTALQSWLIRSVYARWSNISQRVRRFPNGDLPFRLPESPVGLRLQLWLLAL